MATVIANMSMSLDGFVADRHDDLGPLFDWYPTGPLTTPSGAHHADELPGQGAIVRTLMSPFRSVKR